MIILLCSPAQGAQVTVAHSPGHQRNRGSGAHPEDISPSGTACLTFCLWQFEMQADHRIPGIGAIHFVL